MLAKHHKVIAVLIEPAQRYQPHYNRQTITRYLDLLLEPLDPLRRDARVVQRPPRRVIDEAQILRDADVAVAGGVHAVEEIRATVVHDGGGGAVAREEG
jgi:hypothetical protein